MRIQPQGQTGSKQPSWSTDFPIPSADYDSAEGAVKEPLLVDATGIDPRFKSAARTFPGFKALGVNSSNTTYTFTGGVWTAATYRNGPLLVGPGIDHVSHALAAGSTPGTGDLNWFFLPFRLYGQQTNTPFQVRFLKPVEFKESASSSRVVSGFMALVPLGIITAGAGGGYPCYPSPGVAAPDYNIGLPPEVGLGQMMLVLFYYDFNDYYHPWLPADRKVGPGWRARILNATSVAVPDGAVATGTANPVGSINFDVTSWGQFAYACAPDLTRYIGGTERTSQLDFWGMPRFAGVEAYSNDQDPVYGGPVVLYYSPRVSGRAAVTPGTAGAGGTYVSPDGNGYVKIRQMGAAASTTMRTVQHPTPGGTLTDGAAGAGAPGTAQDPIGYSAVGYKGKLYHVDDEWCEVSATLRNSTTGSRTALQVRAIMGIPAGGPGIGTADYGVIVAANLEIPLSAWTDFDRVELWRSAIGTPGVSYLENSFALGTAPAYDATIDGSTTVRTHFVCWGAGDTAAIQAAFTNRRFGFLGVGKTDPELLNQEVFDTIWEFTARPPANTSRMLVENKVCYVSAEKGTNYDAPTGYTLLTGGDTQNLVGIPSKLRWSSLVRPNPENFAETNNTYWPDEEVGMVYELVRSGDWNYAVGTRNLLAFRRTGNRLVINVVGENLVPVNRFGFAAGKKGLFILTKEGLYFVQEDQAVPIEGFNRQLFAEENWGLDLLANGKNWDTNNVRPTIGVSYDESLDMVILRNVERWEALCYHVRTGAFTKLGDFVWKFAFSACLPNGGQYPTTRRSYYTLPNGIEDNNTIDGQTSLELFYVDAFTLPNEDAQYSMRGPAFTEDSAQSPQELLSAISWNNLSLDVTAVTATTVRAVISGLDANMETELGKLLLGGIVHLYNTTNGTHIRRMITRVERVVGASTWLRLTIRKESGNGLTTGEIDSLDDAGSKWVIAPVPVRIMPAQLDKGPLEASGSMIAVSTGQIGMDVVANNKDTADSSGCLIYASGWSGNEDQITGGYGNAVTAVTGARMFAPGRLKESAKAVVTPTRRIDRCTFKLPFADPDVFIAIEAYPAGARLEFSSLRVLGTPVPTTRRTA